MIAELADASIPRVRVRLRSASTRPRPICSRPASLLSSPSIVDGVPSAGRLARQSPQDRLRHRPRSSRSPSLLRSGFAAARLRRLLALLLLQPQLLQPASAASRRRRRRRRRRRPAGGGGRLRRQRHVDPQLAAADVVHAPARRSRVTTTWQNRFLCCPAGAVGVDRDRERDLLRVLRDLQLRRRHLRRQADRASPSPCPSNGVATVHLARTSACPCPARRPPRSMVERHERRRDLDRRQLATTPTPARCRPSAVAEHRRLPLPHRRAAVGVHREQHFVLPLRDRRPPTPSRRPAGCTAGTTVIGALKPGCRSATIFRFIDPLCTSGTFGSTIAILNGTSSVDREQRLAASCR